MDLINLLKELSFYSNKKCLFCLEEKIDSFYLCKTCIEKLEYIDRSIEIEDNIQCFYPLYYNNFLREKIREYKFGHKSYMAKVFSSLLGKYVREKNLKDFDYLLYVPISKRTSIDRGYNQVELIGKRLAEDLNIDLIDFFEKVIDTSEQNKVGWKERKTNLKNTLEIKEEYRNKGILKNKKILILDDLITSGATLRELCYLLKNEGLSKITSLVIASRRR